MTPDLMRLISRERFLSYKLSSDNHDLAAVQRYFWNIALCESLYPILQVLEVAYRNSLHQALCEQTQPDWLATKPQWLRNQEQEAIFKAAEAIQKRGKPVTSDYLLTELSFGFWTSLADSHYEIMWHKIIKKTFPTAPAAQRTRGEISCRLTKIRRLRNRIFHHGSIWHWSDLTKQHTDMLQLLGWLGQDAIKLIQPIGRFHSVYQAGEKFYRQAAQAITETN
jgi:hypothetical protein